MYAIKERLFPRPLMLQSREREKRRKQKTTCNVLFAKWLRHCRFVKMSCGLHLALMRWVAVKISKAVAIGLQIFRCSSSFPLPAAIFNMADGGENQRSILSRDKHFIFVFATLYAGSNVVLIWQSNQVILEKVWQIKRR